MRSGFSLLIFFIPLFVHPAIAKKIGGRISEGANSICMTEDGLLMTGWTQSYTAVRYDVWVVKTNFKGEKIWAKNYGGKGYEQGMSISPAGKDGFVVAGWTYFPMVMGKRIYGY